MFCQHQLQSSMITVRQVRMAKALLGIQNPELQRLTGLHRNTLSRLERGAISTRTLRLLRRFFEEKGIVFIEDELGRVGVIYKPQPDELMLAAQED